MAATINTTQATPNPINDIRILIGTPPTNIIMNVTGTNIIAVPRSGSASTRRKGKPTIIKIEPNISVKKANHGKL